MLQLFFEVPVVFILHLLTQRGKNAICAVSNFIFSFGEIEEDTEEMLFQLTVN